MEKESSFTENVPGNLKIGCGLQSIFYEQKVKANCGYPLIWKERRRSALAGRFSYNLITFAMFELLFYNRFYDIIYLALKTNEC